MAPVVVRLDQVLSPFEILSRFADLPDPCLLHSAVPGHPLSRFSYFAADPVAMIAAPATEWPSVRDRIRATITAQPGTSDRLPSFRGGWMGWFSYELGAAFDDVARHPNQPLAVPDVALGLYDWVIAWDHSRDAAWLISSGVDPSGRCDEARARMRAEVVLARLNSTGMTSLPVRAADSGRTRADFTAAAYQAAVSRVIEHVLAGDIFQANLAQRFTAAFHGSSVALYHDLMQRSPAPMAAFVRHGPITVVSASPEQFIRLDAGTREVTTRPIKGTRPRGGDPQHDAALAHDLVTSEKDRAENVMIVDLLRNDLLRVCEPGSVRVPVLCALESHSTVHHLVSTVTGLLRPQCDAFDLLAAAFPGGSITGAPKLRAMAIIAELEPVARGAYSGAIGWIGLDGSIDTSIAIRTITIADGTASFHAGGGVTALSNPVDEYRETLDKAKALLAAVQQAR